MGSLQRPRLETRRFRREMTPFEVRRFFALHRTVTRIPMVAAATVDAACRMHRSVDTTF